MVRGRQPNGTVEPGTEYEALRDRLISALKGLRDPRTGATVVREVYKREEIFAGPHFEDAPDISFVTDPTYITGHRVDFPFLESPPAGEHDWTGDHRMDGVLCLVGAGVFREGANLIGTTVLDVAPTLFHAAGLPVPSDFDGRVLADAFVPGYIDQHPVERGEILDGASLPPIEYSEEEEAGIRAALQGLGYIE
jgi:predicted AlkP superfamily phosphohydrolase/phosphomutase